MLGMLSYYSKFLLNLSSEFAPLHKLLEQSVPWKWKTEQQEAFDKSKRWLSLSQLLVHYDPKFEIRLACDVLAYGIGAVLSHLIPYGSEKLVGFASRTLTDTEKSILN